ncbi:SUMO-interacting motif-containing protein 1 isoform X2 [Hoplias malabaricus]|uniref:SUMO-interacting motif-containing protein 1 isoform X2 n=1 Tax=Hoplias malabaricus TaxID=27720 RepID=UPI003463660D
MDEVISLSSGSSSEQDSDIEIVGSYSNEKEHSVPFIRAELLPVTPVLVDITGQQFPLLRQRYPRRVKRGQSSTIEIIDLNDDLSSDSTHMEQTQTGAENGHVESSVSKPCIVNLDKDEIYLDSSYKFSHWSAVSMPSDGDPAHQYDTVDTDLEEMSIQRESENNSHHRKHTRAPENKAPGHSDTFDPILSTQKLQNYLELQNTTLTQQTFSFSPHHNTELCKEKDEFLHSPQSCLDRIPSPFSLDSPYYCRSEIDDVLFSETSNNGDENEQLPTTCSLFSVYPTESSSKSLAETKHLHEGQHANNSPTSQAKPKFPFETLPASGGPSPPSSLPCGQPCSPTSTEILAGDSPDTLASAQDLTMESPPISPSLPHPESLLTSITDTVLLNSKDSKCLVSLDSSPSSQWIMHALGDMDIRPGLVSDHLESHPQKKQLISLAQFKKLKPLIGGGVQDVSEDEEEEENYSPAEPLCRQSLSLVNSTIEENYPEGTLQLLSDLIQPRYYPPLDITAHLLKGILLDPQCAEVLALEAFNLLMRTQKYHPADTSTIPWDWELLASVMTEKDEARRIRSEARCLVFQYVLRVLEDDFQFKLRMLKLHLSVAKVMLSCDQKFRQVRDLLNWLLEAAKQSFCYSEEDGGQKSEQNLCLKMLLILQRMLLLAMEVDRSPTCSCNKLSQELCNSLNSSTPCRQLRLLLLSTLESNLLRCKLLELLLDQACSQKRQLPMSFQLLLHFLQTSTLAPDPSDGSEKWRRWDELLQLVWMLMLSYEEVMTGHLRCSITERFTLTRTPLWTQNDQITRAAIQEAAETFLSRAMKDLGHALPSKTQESLSQLQEYLLSISFS